MLYQTAFDNPLSPEDMCCFFFSGFFSCWVFLSYSSEEVFITAEEGKDHQCSSSSAPVLAGPPTAGCPKPIERRTTNFIQELVQICVLCTHFK